MYALADITEGDCYLRVPPDPGTVAAALGASAAAALGASASAAPGAGTSPPSGTAPTESFHTFTLDSGASRYFFRDSTTLTPLRRPVAVSLADPSGGSVLAHSSTVLPGADLQDAWVDQFTPGGQRVTHCTCSRTGRLLATFTRRPGSSLYTLTTAPPPVPASGQVAASSQVFAAASRSSPASAPCSCRPLAHETLLWHHRLGHPSLLRLRGMASRALVSGLPRSFPPLPPGPAPTCVPCVEGRQRAAPHSSSFPPTEAPMQTLHMDVWGPARVRGQGHERYFLLVIDDYSRYTTVFPLRSKGEVIEVLIDWICAARRQLSESFGSDLPVLRLHSDRGREFSSDLLRAFCRLEGIRQTFTLPASPQQNGIAERRIGMYAAHQINLQPRVSLPETTPTLRWTGKVGDASAFRVWGSRAFVRDTTADKLSSRADVTFDESVSYYHLDDSASFHCSTACPSALSSASSLPDGPDPESNSLRAARPTVTRFLATAVTDPLFEFSAASALVAELVDFSAACLLDYTASLVADSASVSVCPPFVGGECALGTDVLEDRQEDLECFAAASPHLVSMLLAPEGDPDALDISTPRSYTEAIEGPYSSQWQAAMDAEMASWKSTGTYVDEVPPPGANIVSGMWIFRVKRPPGSRPAFKARYVARGFRANANTFVFTSCSSLRAADDAVCLYIAGTRTPETVCEHPLFLNMRRAVDAAGPGYVPPKRCYVGGAELLACKKQIEKGLAPITKTRKETGVTIISDMMTDKIGRGQMNIICINASGAVFQQAVDCKAKTMSGAFIVRVLLIIEKVGPKHVDAICTDGGTNYVSAGKLLQKKYPHIEIVTYVLHRSTWPNFSCS
ncbi:unnamed protein product [Closterium sp. NIES-54]